ncbi:MAG TPA: hypothetical protein VJZ76_00475 [Thermoanaerobaculia bacterium]|nr:hypothetical protein [Thermoanaerobaculia bacterium]
MTSLDLPDGSSYALKYADDGQPQPTSYGVLSTLTLPTKGSISYTYDQRFIPAEDFCGVDYGEASGYGFGSGVWAVKTRTFAPAVVSGTASSETWTYDFKLLPDPAPRSVWNCSSDPNRTIHPPLYDEMVVTVTGPTGGTVANHFSVWPGGDIGRQPDPDTSPAGFKRSNFELPFGRYDSAQDHYLSQEIFNAAGTALRSVWVRHDVFLESGGTPRTSRLVSQRTVFRDDPSGCAGEGASANCAWTQTDSSDWDSVAHHRVVASTANFGSGGVSRTVTTSWNKSNGSPRTIQLTDPWIVNTYEDRITQESGQTAVEQACFDFSTGFLKAKRQLAGSSPQKNDLLAMFTADGSGDLVTEAYYGGDNAPLPAGANAANLCSALPSLTGVAPEYQIDHQWQNGRMSSAKYHNASFFSADLDIDLTGLVRHSRDTNGLQTEYTYDTSGRLTAIAPPGVKPTSFQYIPATGQGGVLTQPAMVDAQTVTSGSGIVHKQYQFDSYGRLWREKQLMADGNWSVRETLYDAKWRKRSVSGTEQLPAGSSEFSFVPASKTTYEYDPLDRPVRITAPDGSVTNISYGGVRTTTRSNTVAADWTTSGTATVSTKETYDGFGRLASVTEASATGPGNVPQDVTTTYGYDVGGRIASVSTPAEGVTQTRTFAYDNRGLLLRDTQPETGILGNGTTSYQEKDVSGNVIRGYDSRGHLGVKQAAGTQRFTQRFSYDSAERLTDVQVAADAAGTSWRPFKRLEYGTAGTANGKLLTATRHNYLWQKTTTPRDTIVTDHYAYDAVSGAVKERTTCAAIVDLPTSLVTCDGAPANAQHTFKTTFAHDDLGAISEIGYPVSPADTNTPSWFAVNSFTNGFLTAVKTRDSQTGTSQTIAQQAYAPNGMVNKITHLLTDKPALTDDIAPDSSGMTRPRSIAFNGWLPPCQTPQITGPDDAQVGWQGTAQLQVQVPSGETVSYQWYSSSGKLNGKTDSTLTVADVEGTSQYWVEVTNSCGTTTSRTATVSLNCGGPDIVMQPYGGPLNQGQYQVAVVAQGTGLTYQWFKGPARQTGQSILIDPNGQGPSLTVTAPGSYWVIVTGGCRGDIAPSDAAIVVNQESGCDLISIQQQPVSIDVAAGDDALFAVQAGGTSPRYQWQERIGNIWYDTSGATSNVLRRTAVLTSAIYRIDVKNDCPLYTNPKSEVFSQPATVHVTSCALVKIQGQPNDQQVFEGNPATLTFSATLKDIDLFQRSVSIQWYQGETGDDSHPLASTGFLNQSYQTAPLQNDTKFWARIVVPPGGGACVSDIAVPAVVCSGGCSVDTRTVRVSVCHPPAIIQQPAGTFTTPGVEARVPVNARGTGLKFQWYYGTTGDISHPAGLASPSSVGQIPITQDNTRVWVRIVGDCGQVDSIDVNIRLCYPPVFTTQPPETLTVLTGQTPRITVDTNQADATYQWWEGTNGAGVPVATGKDFTLPLLPGETTHTYFARATGTLGCHTDSRVMTVSVCTPPAITSWLTEYYTSRGANVDIRVVASADATTYTWYRGVTGDVSHLDAGPNSSTTLSRAPTETTQYWVRVSNGRCTSDSPTATVYVCTPDIVTQPLARNIAAGTSANLSVTAAGSQPFSYQWYEGQSGDASHPLAGYTQQNVTVSPAQDKSYWVAVTSPCPTPQPAKSTAALIRVCSPPVITASPASKTVCLGTSTDLTVTATGTDLHYQWWIGPSGTTTQPIGNSDRSTITVTPTQTTTYWVQVTSGCVPTGASTPTANSTAATLTVNVPPTVTGPDDKSIVQGNTAQLTVSANQTSTFEWYQGVSGNTANHVWSGTSFTTPGLSQTTQYWVRASNGTCTTDSRTVTVNVCIPPAISQWTSDMTSPRGATVALNVTASAGTTSYTLYLGNAPDVSHPINGAGAGTSASFNVAPLQTTSYWVRVSNGSCFRDSGTTTIYVCTPDITTQPAASQTIPAGTQTTLSVVAAGTTPLSYQWYQGASPDTTHPMNGYTTSSIQVAPTVNTSYWVSVASPCPTPAPARSATAVVNVCTPASITTQPQSQTLRLGSSIDLTVTATASNATLHYQWWIGTQPVGTDSPRLTVSPSQTTTYTVSVVAKKSDGNNCGSTVNSAPATVTVCVPPTVTGPDDKTAVINQPATLTVSANQSCTYEWYQGAAPNTSVHVWTGATFTTPSLSQPTQYWVRASNGSCTTDSRTATVSICTPPSITTNPTDQTTTSGQLVYLTVAASSDATTYTWYQGTAPDASTPIVGPGNYPTIGVAPQATTSYWVRVGNGSCSTDSTTATVRVCGPLITQQPQNVSIVSGSTTTLSVAANGTPPLSYQWYNGTAPSTASPITTDGNQSYLNVSPTTSKSYWVRVSTSCGSADSRTVAVTVTPCTTVAINSTSSYYDGTAWQLSASVTGTAVQAEWYKSDPPGSTYVRFATTATTSLVPQSSTVYVYVRAYNPCSSRIQYLTLTIPGGGMAPTIASDPSSATYSGKTPPPLHVKAHGRNLSYQWYSSDPDGSPYVPISGQHSPDLAILPQSPVASYYALVMNDAGLVQTAAATLRQVSCAAPKITAQPSSDGDAAAGSRVLLSVDAAGDGPLAYQWFASDARGGGWKPVDGGTWNALGVDAGAPAYYFVRVSNACGTADSNYVSVAPSDGCAAPSIASQPRGAAMDQQSGAALGVDANALDYQWFRSDGPMAQWLEVPGATKRSARLAAQLVPAYSYVRVRKCGKTVNSDVAAVRTLTTGCAPPSVATEPSIVMATPGTPVTLTVDASGDSLSYQWFLSDPDSVSPPALVQDSASNTFSYTPASPRSLVFVRVTNGACGTFTDMPGYWAVISAPPCGTVEIIHQPDDVTIAAGETAQLTVTAGASCPLTYQWYVGEPSSGWTPLDGETSSTLRVTPSETQFYRVNVAAADGTVVASHTAAVRIK